TNDSDGSGARVTGVIGRLAMFGKGGCEPPQPPLLTIQDRKRDRSPREAVHFDLTRAPRLAGCLHERTSLGSGTGAGFHDGCERGHCRQMPRRTITVLFRDDQFRTTSSLSRPDWPPHTSPGRPASWRTSASFLSLGKLSNRSVTGS